MLEVLYHARMGMPHVLIYVLGLCATQLPPCCFKPCSALPDGPALRCNKFWLTTELRNQRPSDWLTPLFRNRCGRLRPLAAMSTKGIVQSHLARCSVSCAAQSRPSHHVAFTRHAYRRCSYHPRRGPVRCPVSSPRCTLTLPKSAKVYSDCSYPLSLLGQQLDLPSCRSRA